MILLQGTRFFHLVGNELYSNASLDRDRIGTEEGPGPHVDVNVKCVVWDEKTGVQLAVERNIPIDILDEDDNPPISQINEFYEINLQDFTKVI